MLLGAFLASVELGAAEAAGRAECRANTLRISSPELSQV